MSGSCASSGFPGHRKIGTGSDFFEIRDTTDVSWLVRRNLRKPMPSLHEYVNLYELTGWVKCSKYTTK